MTTVITHSPAETKHLGQVLGRRLKPNMVVGLSGGLGAGKTVLVKGIAYGMGIAQDEILSPTFVLIREYKGKKMPLFHFDFYRLEKTSAINSLGMEEYFSRGGACVVEWADKVKDYLPKECLLITIDILSENERKFRFQAKGRIYRGLITNRLRVIRFTSHV